MFALSKVIRETSKYPVYAVNVGWRNDKSRRSYVHFGNMCSEIEFIETCFDKLVISLSRVTILSSEVEDVYKTYLWWHG